MNQIEASKKVLEDSQQEKFPYSIHEFGLELVVFKGVFSPKHFNGWKIFTRYLPQVKGKEVLEIGPGHGATSVYLAKQGAKRVVALDINPRAIENTLENAKRNHVCVDARVSDIYSALSPNEQFDFIYWNTPFMYVPEEYQYASMLERGLFDPGYKLTERFLKEGTNHLKPQGKILFGTGNFGDIPRFKALAKKHKYTTRLIVKEDSLEINPIDFQLYALTPK